MNFLSLAWAPQAPAGEPGTWCPLLRMTTGPPQSGAPPGEPSFDGALQEAIRIEPNALETKPDLSSEPTQTMEASHGGSPCLTSHAQLLALKQVPNLTSVRMVVPAVPNPQAAVGEGPVPLVSNLGSLGLLTPAVAESPSGMPHTLGQAVTGGGPVLSTDANPATKLSAPLDAKLEAKLAASLLLPETGAKAMPTLSQSFLRDAALTPQSYPQLGIGFPSEGLAEPPTTPAGGQSKLYAVAPPSAGPARITQSAPLLLTSGDAVAIPHATLTEHHGKFSPIPASEDGGDNLPPVPMPQVILNFPKTRPQGMVTGTPPALAQPIPEAHVVQSTSVPAQVPVWVAPAQAVPIPEALPDGLAKKGLRGDKAKVLEVLPFGVETATSPPFVAERGVAAELPILRQELPQALQGEVLRRVQETLNELLEARRSRSVTIKLHPEELGEVVLKIQTFGARVDTEVRSNNEHVRQVLVEARAELARTVESKGLSMGSFSVGHQDASQSWRGDQQPMRQEFERIGRLSLGSPQLVASTPPSWLPNSLTLDYRI